MKLRAGCAALVLAWVALLAGAARADPRWESWQLLMWQEKAPAQFAGLRALGFTGVKLRATGGMIDPARRAALDAAGMPYWLENVATDFYAPYHRFTEGRAVNWLYEQARARYRADPADPAVFHRTPSLSDPAWIASIVQRVGKLAAGPLFLNLADEPGIADLAAAWDADTSPASLVAFRSWLQRRYVDLPALNQEWGTGFVAWDAVVPELTDAALRRTDQNFAAWGDFKAFMDVAFAGAVAEGAQAVRRGGGLAGLEGGQIPGWGGYDYARLAPVLDVMEIYDAGDALDLAMAANPALIALRTSFGSGPREVHAQWRHVLRGGRGTVVWDEADDVVGPDGAAGPRGRNLAALHGRIAAVAPLLRNAAPDPDAVAVLVNQASFRLRWLLDRRAGDRDWVARDAEREYDDNAWRAARRTILGRLAEIGVQPRLVSRLDASTLLGMRAVILSHAIALDDAELVALAAFRDGGGTVLFDTEPGLFDGSGRRRAQPPLPGVPQAPLRSDGAVSAPGTLAALAALMEAAGVPPRVRLTGPDGQLATGLELRWFRGTAGALLSVQAATPWGAPGQVTVSGAVVDATDGAPVSMPMTLDPVVPRLLRVR